MDNIFSTADSLISKDNPVLHVANFSSSPIVISEGQLLGTGRNPSTWLDRDYKLSGEQRSDIERHARLIQALVEVQSATVSSQTEISSKAQRNATEQDDPAVEEPLEGGPKTAETPQT